MSYAGRYEELRLLDIVFRLALLDHLYSDFAASELSETWLARTTTHR